MTYTITISEAQRQYLLSALSHTKSSGYLGADREGREEIDALADMFDALPIDNADEPIHDFTA